MEHREIRALAAGFAPVIDEKLNKLRAEIAGLKAENSTLKAENVTLKAELHGELATLKAELAAHQRELAEVVEQFGFPAGKEAAPRLRRLS